MTEAEKAFREAFRGAQGVPPVPPLDPHEIRALAGDGSQRRARRQPSRWLAAAAAAVVVVGGGSIAWNLLGNRGSVPAVPAAPPSASATGATSVAADPAILGFSGVVTDLPGVTLSASDPDQTIDFSSDSGVNGTIGCTTFTAHYALSGSRLTFGTVDVVAVPCASGPARLIQPMIDALGRTRSVTLTDDGLRFTTASGEVALTLRRTPAGDIFARTRALADAPDAVRNPGVLISCGRFELGQAGTVGAEALQCLAAPYSGVEGAELAVTVPTTEGDPIVFFFQHTTGAIRVYSTDHWDNWRGGNGGWTTRNCPVSAAGSWQSLRACAG